ncbi:MAG: SMP-30/gluconolactonase/LRE family protein [Aestuariivirga sp.]|uniref:SMP-30/gluconolactonase/LRE family protein n=1 Tax=Aestuariivirga sp. TaxID=2650926 RepID=UPI0038D240EE
MKNLDVRCAADSRDDLGEGAMWCPAEQVLYWLNIPMPSRLHRHDPATGRHESWAMPEMITALAKRRDGTLLIASHHGLNRFDPREGRLIRVAVPEADKPENRSNDGAPDAQGRFWMGTMMNNLGPSGEDLPIAAATGALWCVNPDFTFHKAIDGIMITNGVAWSPDQRTLYVADSAAQVIYAYDFDPASATVSNRRVFSDDKSLGYPDGAAVDSEGGLWSARWEGQCVARFRPDGRLDFTVPIPAPRVTSIAFGGRDFRTAYVTTARHGASAGELARFPRQGSLFAFDSPIAGLPRPQFAG